MVRFLLVHILLGISHVHGNGVESQKHYLDILGFHTLNYHVSYLVLINKGSTKSNIQFAMFEY